MSLTITNERHFRQKKIKKLKNHTFVVEDYQRGYKWDFNQVLDLLKDINEFNTLNTLNSYCLQPVAVKKIGDNNKYELVDGQQRLTTIYIILKICGLDNFFKIDYKTRPESRIFLENINSFPEYNFDLWEDNSVDVIEKKLNKCWSDFIQDKKNEESNIVNYDNVDNYHFFQAALVIRSFFEKKENDKSEFLNKLKDKVKVIWYQDPTEQSANSLFKNLNSGKIRLSASDLIKALFILDLEKKHELPFQIEFEQNKLASEWDEIEQQLHDPKFWSFIIGNTTRNYGDSRIGYLFEILTDTLQHKNIYECYRSYSKLDKEGALDWKTVTNLFFTLKEWYSEVQTYHRIGFLMRQNIKKWKTLREIYEAYICASDKSAFEDVLEKSIVTLFNETKITKEITTSIYDLDVLNYHNLTEVRNLLVMLNILTYERIMPDYRIDFEQFYGGQWSVEHIQPQNPKDIDFDDIDEYLSEINLSIEAYKNEDMELVKLIKIEFDELLKIKKGVSSSKEKRDYLTSFNTFMSEKITPLFKLHGIGNLALLRSDDNSSLGNKTFMKKRKKISDVFDTVKSSGKFIPIATLQVFTKFYTKEKVQLKFWSQQDSLDYKNSIAEIMKNYLPKKEVENV
ncbi:hypothetical protein SCB49_02519 [unidentified eubacterium SCB49]|nr:hypothetical protein SCB49_02519 [unidentified eubacterium SCB49]